MAEVDISSWDTWAQCEACGKWRNLGGLDEDQVPDEWYCNMNPDELCASCDVPEEPEEDADAAPPVELLPGQFEVSMLLAKRRNWRTRRTEYLVRWKGFDDPDEDTWEVEANILHPGCARPSPPGAACAEPNPTHISAPHPTPASLHPNPSRTPARLRLACAVIPAFEAARLQPRRSAQAASSSSMASNSVLPQTEESFPRLGGCGTFGCTLPDRHRGLHILPSDSGEPRQRRAPRAYAPTLRGKTYEQATVGNGSPGSRPQPWP